MSYTPTTWSTGDTITADKLNHMEDGIAEGGGGGNITFFPLTYDETNDCYSTTASYNDVLQAMSNGVAIFKEMIASVNVYTNIVLNCFFNGSVYSVESTSLGGSTLTMTSPDATSPLSSCGGEPIG